MSHSTMFDQLLQAAAEQPEPQRLLFVFTAAELPDDATPAQRERFAAGAGGNLEPLMCVDKGLDELSSFVALSAEACEAGPPWQVMFAAGLPGSHGAPPSPAQVERAMEALLERVRKGQLGGLLALDAQGAPLQFD